MRAQPPPLLFHLPGCPLLRVLPLFPLAAAPRAAAIAAAAAIITCAAVTAATAGARRWLLLLGGKLVHEGAVVVEGVELARHQVQRRCVLLHKQKKHVCVQRACAWVECVH